MGIKAGSGRGASDPGGTRGGGGSFGNGGRRARRNHVPMPPPPPKKPLQPIENPFPQKPEFRLGQYRIIEERDDYLICTGFDPNAKNPFAEVTPDAFRKIKVAKPWALQRTGWDGETVEIGGVEYTYEYSDSEKGVRTATSDDGEEEQRIDIPYLVDDLLVAVEIRKNAANDGTDVRDEEGTRLRWMDLNVSGRHWKGDGGGNVDVTGNLLGAWTISEHEPLTGTTIGSWYRGTSLQAGLSRDYDLMLTSGGGILTNGEIITGGNNGVGVLIDEASREVIWRTDIGSVPNQVTSTVGAIEILGSHRGRHLLETDDGFFWLAGGDSVGRITPGTGVMTHRYIRGGVTRLFPSVISNHVVVAPAHVSHGPVAILDDTASAIATTAVGDARIDVLGSTIVGLHQLGDWIRIYDPNDLSVLDDSGSLGFTVGNSNIATDGTNVYFSCTVSSVSTLKARALSNLTSDVWSVGSLSPATTSVQISPVNGFLYLFSGTTALTIRKVDPSDGSTVWTSSTLWSGALTSNAGPVMGSRCGFGSDFIVVTANSSQVNSSLHTAGSTNVACIDDSNGTTRWLAYDGEHLTGTYPGPMCWGMRVTDDDRILVAHMRMQQ